MVSDTRLPFAWTAVAFPQQRQVWFALKDPRLLRATIFWISNGGRYYPPWNGRHRNVMGLAFCALSHDAELICLDTLANAFCSYKALRTLKHGAPVKVDNKAPGGEDKKG